MKKDIFWKNFNLGKELDISGSFIYNGLRSVEEMEHLYFEEESFLFLYNISVGIERLLKVAIILMEHDGITDQKKFEDSLRTHNHQELIQRIVKRPKTINLGKQHNRFLEILSDFYKNMRYDRFVLDNAGSYDKEKKALQNFITKEIGIDFSKDSMMIVTPVGKEIKQLLGNTIGKIASEIYSIIKQEAHRLNISTEEIRVDSKAYKIFMRQEYDFLSESRLWKEILIYAINSNENGLIDLLKEQKSIAFDNGSMNDYFECFSSSIKQLKFLDELDYFYEDELEASEKKERFELLDAIADPGSGFNALG